LEEGNECNGAKKEWQPEALERTAALITDGEACLTVIMDGKSGAAAGYGL
jgi:hypothetical protein